MSLSGLINYDSIEILHLYKFPFGGFACCNNDLYFIEDLKNNLVFDVHKVIELVFSKFAYAVVEESQKRPLFNILDIFGLRLILLELALSAEVAIRRLYLFFIIGTLNILLIIMSYVCDVFKIFSL